MKKADVDDYLKNGIYGSKVTKPSERKKYLGTIRERILLALTKGQVMQGRGIEELANTMKQHKDAKLLLNGKVNYRFLREYRSLANKHGVSHTTISNQQAKTDIGAVLTLDYAIDREKIHLEEKEVETEEKKKGLKGFLKSLFTPIR
ncbi:YueI family protein [Thalassobacillus pellis]|uniref:YueI family protein n=1 Tax=Thalassobacillus pellis TaxID=748008 RepID=UPI001961BFF4|nr:YueI family protein [Thalassobacillus pellis]MBM7554325.1 uncharacterized protein YueI [Thalassobacillus pellis]